MKLANATSLVMGAILLLAGTAFGAPCTSTSGCFEWVASDLTRVLVYRSFPLELSKQLQNQATSRPMTYLLGGFDTLTIGGFDRSCAGMAQGPTRTARGLAWTKFINDNFGASHEVRVVPTCGHNSRCMFTDDAAVDLLFPKP